MNLDALIPVIVAVIAAIPGLIALSGQRRKDGADVATTYSKLAADQAEKNRQLQACQEEMEKRIDALEAAWADAEDYVSRLEVYVDELVTVMRGAGLQPVRPRPVRKRVV